MQIARTITGVKHSLPITNRELRQRDHFSQIPSAAVQMSAQATAQCAVIAAYYN